MVKNHFHPIIGQSIGKPPSTRHKKRTPLEVFIVVGMVIGLIQLSTLLFAPNPEQDAWGKIISPVSGSPIASEITIVGETQDIATGQYIWITVDKPDTRQCRPQKRVLRNTRFRAKIQNHMFNPPVFISIYVINESLHEQWTDMKQSATRSYIPSPPERRRLDSICLIP